MTTTDLERLDEYPGTGPVGAGALFHARRVSDSKDFRVPTERLPGGGTVGNAARIPLKVVATYADLLALDPLTCCFGTEAVVLLPAPGEAPRYVLKYVDHAFAWAYVCQDGNFDQNPSNLSDGQWIAVDSPRAGLQDYTQYPTGYSFPAGTFVAAYVSGQTTEQIAQALAPDGPRPAPTGLPDDPYWALASLTDVPPPRPASFQELTGEPRDNAALADALAAFATTAGMDAADAELQTEINDLGTRVTATENDTDALDIRVTANTAALATRLNYRGGWAANTAYLKCDMVSVGSTAYYVKAPFTSGATLSRAGLSRFGADANGVPDFTNEVLLDDNSEYSPQGTGGGSYALALSELGLPSVFPTYIGRVDGYRNAFTGPVTLIGDASLNAGIDGADTLVLPAFGDAVWLKMTATGYTVVLDARKAGAPPAPDTLAYAASIAIDFAANPVRTLTLAGNVAFTTTNRSNGREKVLRLIADGTARTLSFPSAWTWLGSAAPTSLAAGKTAILSLTCFGTSEADVVAAYSAQL